MIKIFGDYVKIDSRDSSLIIKNFNGNAFPVYCGKKLLDYDNYEVFARGCWESGASNDDNSLYLSTLGSVSERSSREPFFTFYDEAGVFCNRFRYVGAELTDSFFSPFPTARSKGNTVKFTFTDEISGVTAYQYYTVFEDCGAICAHSELVNTSQKTITVTRLSSLQLDFVGNRADIVSYEGTWKRERIRKQTRLETGRFEMDSKLGISSAQHNPFFFVSLQDKTIGFNLIWSGNHKEIVEISPYYRIRILTGINDYNFRYTLSPGKSLVSPEAVFVVGDCEAEVTRGMHEFVLQHIINPDFKNAERPVLINNWEGTGMNFTGEKIYEMAKVAASVGIELFVLDDGWFGKRDDDTAGLGDWFDNEKKTGGLKNLADKIHALGMKFGLWVEPEMISEDSDLFRAHPEFAMRIPGVEPLRSRSQLCIDLCNKKVKEYLSKTLINLFKSVGVDYVKWDHNRAMSDIYSASLTNQGGYFYDYYVNQYALLKEITEACPNVLFESCASGGSRFDLGMLYFMPQCWASDNTNAYSRLFIQEGTLAGYPQSCMGAHVAGYHYQTPFVSLESMFNVAAIGAFGYEFDITKCDNKQLTIIKNQVEYYKKHRKLLQFGDYYRLGESLVNAETGGYIVVAKDKSEAIAVIITREIGSTRFRPHFSFKGLDENTLYKVFMRPQANVEDGIEFTAYGDALNSFGVDIEDIRWRETDERENATVFASRMFYFHKLA